MLQALMNLLPNKVPKYRRRHSMKVRIMCPGQGKRAVTLTMEGRGVCPECRRELHVTRSAHISHAHKRKS